MTAPDLSTAVFRKSSLSGSSNDNCVEVATNLPGLVAVRDSKDPSGPVLTFPPGVWSDFLRSIRHGHLQE
ncbi:DUF397 domain-containing protein [Streptosporangium carneum]|uniref:DUF397 domain-containing protein n=1 Tax=Streptosporangium carneum TaxID=47481 RepID=A0A9W6I3N9_9ACTN|nr:DUF397 domain-containing protein [Streptosporangium carneum]GLK10613.1 hypothetical protein GCM10017600_40190 [Streptosporangium carneum]